MNALRIILTLVIIFYLTIYDFSYWKYFFAVVIPYFLITQVFMVDWSLNSPKKKAFISMWGHPADPQIYGTMKLDLTKVKEYLKTYSEQVGRKIGFTVFLVKVMGKMLDVFSQVNGNVIFGKFVEKKEVDISVMISLQGGNEFDLITVKNCSNLTMEEISKKIQEKKDSFDNGSDKGYRRRLFMAKMLPTFLLSPFVRIMSYLSTCGLNLSWLWLPKYGYGTCVISNVGKLGVDYAYLPIPPYTYAPVAITINRWEKKKKLDAGVFKDTISLDLNFTIDHRYMDGAYASKIAAEVDIL